MFTTGIIVKLSTYKEFCWPLFICQLLGNYKTKTTNTIDL